MTTQPPSPVNLDAATGEAVLVAQPPAPEEKGLLAPIWHTILIVLIVLANSALSWYLASRAVGQRSLELNDKQRIAQYTVTIAFELFLLLLVWIGLRLKRTRIRDLVGGRWNSPEAFLIDICIAVGFWLVSLGVLYCIGWLLGLTRGAQVDEAKKLAAILAPHSLPALAVFILLSVVAGFVEEIIFRGYLQRQLAVLTGSIYAGIILQALVFGAGHGYEGVRRMFMIFVYGTMYGFLVLWRKSLRPGMMAHALHDTAAGIGLFVLTRKGFPSMP